MPAIAIKSTIFFQRCDTCTEVQLMMQKKTISKTILRKINPLLLQHHLNPLPISPRMAAVAARQCVGEAHARPPPLRRALVPIAPLRAGPSSAPCRAASAAVKPHQSATPGVPAPLSARMAPVAAGRRGIAFRSAGLPWGAMHALRARGPAATNVAAVSPL